MKNATIGFTIVLALICSQACAQKKSDSGGSSKAQSGKAALSSSTKAMPTASLAVSKKTKESRSTTELGESEKSKRGQKSSATDRTTSKATSPDELTDEQQKKMKSMLRQTLKPFVAVDLTDAQRQQADELFAKAIKDYVVKRSKSEITDDMQKEHAAAMKQLKSGSKSTRDQAKEAFVTAGFSDDQIKVFKATQTSLNKAKREFGKSLTDKQIDLLPESLQAIISGEEK